MSTLDPAQNYVGIIVSSKNLSDRNLYSGHQLFIGILFFKVFDKDTNAARISYINISFIREIINLHIALHGQYI